MEKIEYFPNCNSQTYINNEYIDPDFYAGQDNKSGQDKSFKVRQNYILVSVHPPVCLL